MVNVYDAPINDLIEKTAQELKDIEAIKEPEWAQIVKTGPHKQRPPIQKDWWYTRAAAVLRSVYKLGPIGVSKLRTKYGGKKNRGHKPEAFRKGSGSIIRHIFQQLDEAGLTKKAEKGVYKGRVITEKGKKLLDNIAKKIVGSYSKPEPKPAAEKKVTGKKEPEKSADSKVVLDVEQSSTSASLKSGLTSSVSAKADTSSQAQMKQEVKPAVSVKKVQATQDKKEQKNG